jgi:hypothetical protein
MPVQVDEVSMRPVEPLCSLFRHLAYAGKASKTMRGCAYIQLRLADFLAGRGRDVLSAIESDLVAYRVLRTETQAEPVGDAMWGEEAQLVNQLYRWLAEYGHIRHRPLRLDARGRNPLAPRLRRGMDFRHLTLDQYRFFRDVGLGGQLPDSRADGSFRAVRGAAQPRGGGPGVEHGDAASRVVDGAAARAGRPVRCPGEPVEFTVQACAKYGMRREVFVPAGALDAVEAFLLRERPELAFASAKVLARRHRDLFVVSRVEAEAGRVHGTLGGRRRVFAMPAIDPKLRRIKVWETEAGLEPLAVFIGHDGRPGRACRVIMSNRAGVSADGHDGSNAAPPGRLDLAPRRYRRLDDPRNSV